jgi:hypothetical protein
MIWGSTALPDNNEYGFENPATMCVIAMPGIPFGQLAREESLTIFLFSAAFPYNVDNHSQLRASRNAVR